MMGPSRPIQLLYRKRGLCWHCHIDMADSVQLQDPSLQETHLSEAQSTGGRRSSGCP